MRFLRRTLVGLFLLSVTVGLLAAAGITLYDRLEARWSEEPAQRPARERVFSVNVATITPDTLRPVLSTFGEVRARRTLELRASSAGEVIWLYDGFEEGGDVSEGQVLLRIDPADAEAALATARADMADAEADLRDAERALGLAADDIAAAEDQARLRAQALTRQQDLADRGVGSAANVETAELALSSARQSILSRRQAEAAAQTRLDQARTTLERRAIQLSDAERGLAETEVTAPFSGLLLDVSVVEGRLVSGNERLAELVDPTALELAFRVSTPQYTRLLGENGQLIGAPVRASIDILGVDLTATGEVSRESAAVGEGQTGRLLFARLDDAPGFRPGDFVSVALEEPPLERVSRLPSSALSSTGGVLVIGEEDRLMEAQVDLLRREGDDVIVRAPDLADARIVAERSPLLGAGIKVRPIDPNADPEAEAEADLVELDDDRRARLVAFVEANERMPDAAKERVLAQLREPMVPVEVVDRIESRM